MPHSHLTSRLPLLATLAAVAIVAVSTPRQASADETRTFVAADKSYSFQYPAGFALAREFADGTGEVTGVTASTPANGDVNIALYVRPAGAIKAVDEQSRQALIDEYTKAVAVRASIKLRSSSMTTMLGVPAVDMIFENKRFGVVQTDRYVATVRDGTAYAFVCSYRAEKTEQFAPACDLAVATAALKGTAAKEKTGSDQRAATAGCTTLSLNKRKMRVTELSSAMLMKDQSPATIERLQKAHQAMAAIDARLEGAPSEQDCKGVDAIIGTLE